MGRSRKRKPPPNQNKRPQKIKTNNDKGENGSHSLEEMLAATSRRAQECGGNGHCGPWSIEYELQRVTGQYVNVRALACSTIEAHQEQLASRPFLFDAANTGARNFTRSRRGVVMDRMDVPRYTQGMRATPTHNAEIFTQMELCATAHGLRRSVYVLTEGDKGWRWVRYRGFGTVTSYRDDGQGGVETITDWGILADGCMNEITEEVPQRDDIAIVNIDNIHFKAAPAVALPSWTCWHCTFVNEKPEFLACEVCSSPKHKQHTQHTQSTSNLHDDQGELPPFTTPKKSKPRIPGGFKLITGNHLLRPTDTGMASARPPPQDKRSKTCSETKRKNLGVRKPKPTGTSQQHDPIVLVDERAKDLPSEE